jgi:hypothetical protein
MVLSLLRSSTITITRDDGGGFWDDKGRWTDDPTPPLPFDIQCSIQPFKLSDTQTVLPEGKQAEDALVVYTSTLLKTVMQISSKETADTTVIDGLTYEAFNTENWSRFGLTADHHKVVFVRHDQPTNGNL